MWPENEQAWRLFTFMGTQWRVAMGGPTGLDYGVLFHRMDRMALPPDDFDLLLSDVRSMESAALGAMTKNRERKT